MISNFSSKDLKSKKIKALSVQDAVLQRLSDLEHSEPLRPDLLGGEKLVTHQVFNFEVAETHTYIADGIRVHNKSVLSHLTPQELASISEVKDTDGDGDLDFATSVYKDRNGHVVGRTNHKMTSKDGKEVLEGHQTYTGEDGKLWQLQYTRDPESGEVIETKYELKGAEFGEGLGELITPYLTSAIIGKDANVFQKIAVDTILGTLVENAFEFAGGNLHSILKNWGEGDRHSNADVEAIADYTFRDIVDDFGANLVGYTSKHLTSWIMAEVFEGVSTDSLAGEMFHTLASRGVGHIVDQGLFHIARDVLDLSPEKLSKFFGLGFDESGTLIAPNLGDNLTKMIQPANLAGLLLSTALGRVLPQIETIEGMIASGAVKLALNVFGTFKNLTMIGGFNPVIMIIGAIVGKLFDSLFEKVPQAYANVKFDADTGRFVVGDAWSDDGGNTEFGKRMANNYVAFMNGFLDQSQSQSNNAAELAETMKLVFGHYEQLIVNGSGRTFATLDAAIQSRVIDTMQNIRLNDGDLKVGDAIAEIKEMADVVDDIRHAGSYTYWKKFFFFKIKKKTVYVSINKDPESSNDELVELVRQSSFSSSDIVADIVGKTNQLFGDLKVSGLNDAEGYKRIIARMMTRGYAHNDALMHKVADILYLRGLAMYLQEQGFSFRSKSEMMLALRRSELTITTDQELFSELTHNTQIAAEYQKYLENQVAYDAAIAAAGEDSAYAQGWALTFMEASRLGLTKDYEATGDDKHNVFVTSSGDDKIHGGKGNDLIKTYSGDDALYGDQGHDTLMGGLGDDTLHGGAGNDVIDGGSGANVSHGGHGNDVYQIGAFGETVVHEYADRGSDTVRFVAHKHDEVEVSFENGDAIVSWDDGKVTIKAGARHVEKFEFTDGVIHSLSDLKNGKITNLRLQGSSGADTLLGGLGQDTINGHGGDDVLRAGANQNGRFQFLNGGSGNDTYRYRKVDGKVYIGSGAERANWGNNDRVVFEDLALGDVTFESFDYRTTKWKSEGESLRILWSKDGESGEVRIANMGNNIEKLEFADGSVVARVNGAWLRRRGPAHKNRTEDQLFGTGGDDVILGSAGTDFIYAGKGDDTIAAGGSDSRHWQRLYGQSGDDVYRYSKGDGLVHIDTAGENAGSGKEDVVHFTDLNMEDITFEYYDYGKTSWKSQGVALRALWSKDGESGELRVSHMGKYIEKFVFADGSVVSRIEADWLKRLDGNRFKNRHDDKIIGSDGGDRIFGSAGRDRIFAGKGDDIIGAGRNVDGGWQYLYGQQGDDSYHYSSNDGSVYISSTAETADSGKNDSIVLTDLSMDEVTFSYYDYTKTAHKTEGLALRIQWSKDGKSGELRVANLAKHIERIEFADGSAVSRIEADFLARANARWAGRQDDKIIGTDGDDYIMGSAGRDRVFGGKGDDTLAAGGSNIGGWQHLYGQMGSDSYRYSTGDGHVYISNSAENKGTGMGDADTVYFDDLTLGDVQFSNYNYRNAEGNALRVTWRKDGKAGELRIANMGNAIERFVFADGTELSAIVAKKTAQNTSGRHRLYGTADSNDIEIGNIAGLEVFGKAGFDSITGGNQADVLHGGDGNDTLIGKANNDLLFGGHNDDVLRGGANSDRLHGGSGDDQLYGGHGIDFLYGGGGNDTYHYNKGDGRDTIEDKFIAKTPYWQAYTVRVRRGGKRKRWVNETRHRIAHRTTEADGGTDTLRFGAGISMDQLRFAQDKSDLVVGLTETGTQNSSIRHLGDRIRVRNWSNNKNRVELLTFEDGSQIDTRKLSRAMTGNAHANRISGTSAGDILAGLGGADSLYAGAGDDYLIGATGNDYLDAGQGADDLFGGSGNDRLYGRQGDDYLLGGDGADSLFGGSGNDVLSGGAGNDLMMGGRGDDTYFLKRGDGKDIINETAFETVTVAKKTTVSVQKNVAQYKQVPVYKTFKSGKSTYRRKVGVRKVYTGTKRIWVNETRTSYRKETRAVEGGKDSLQFGGNISISDLIVNRQGNDLVVQLRPNDSVEVQDQVTIRNWNYHQFRVEDFTFESGFGLDLSRINHAATGGSGQDRLTANRRNVSGQEYSAGANGAREAWLAGAGGNDTLVGSRYSDILLGGDGDDMLFGGYGDDVYVFGYGDGHDVISDGGSNTGSGDSLQLMNGEVFGDKLVFDTGISIENLAITRSGNDLKIFVHSAKVSVLSDALTADDSITIKNWTTQSRRVETLQFADGTDFDISNITHAWTGTTEDDNRTGSNVGDWLAGGQGMDNLRGNDGDDYLLGEAGDDHLQGDNGHDFLSGGAGSDMLNGGQGEDFLSGGEGNDYLQSGDGDDILSGGDGNDVLVDGSGDDVLIGGAGSDVYRNGAGRDIIRFGYGDGADTYHFDGATKTDDVVVLEGELEKEAVWFQRSGADLIMQLNGSTDSIRFTSWFASDTSDVTQRSIHSFVLGDEVLMANEVAKLVSAMAAFDPYDGSLENGVQANRLPDVVTLAVNAAWTTQ